MMLWHGGMVAWWHGGTAAWWHGGGGEVAVNGGGVDDDRVAPTDQRRKPTSMTTLALDCAATSLAASAPSSEHHAQQGTD